MKYDLASDYSLFVANSSWDEAWDKEQAQWLWGEEPNITLGEKIGTIAYVPKQTGWFNYDVTSSTVEMLNAKQENNGYILTCKVNGTLQSSGNQSGFYSSEYVEDSLRPRLTITYKEGGTPVVNQTSKVPLTFKSGDFCSVLISDITGRVIRKHHNVQFMRIHSLVANMKSSGIYLITIENSLGQQHVYKQIR